jgi:hypothetical protein
VLLNGKQGFRGHKVAAESVFFTISTVKNNLLELHPKPADFGTNCPANVAAFRLVCD